MIKRLFITLTLAVAVMAPTAAVAQFNLGKAVSGGVKAVKALTLTDEQMRQYVKEYIDWMDENNPVLSEDDPYAQRLRRLT